MPSKRHVYAFKASKRLEHVNAFKASKRLDQQGILHYY